MSKLAVSLVLGLLSLTAFADTRLIGVWKSDRAASSAFNRAHAKLEEKTFTFLDQMMGRLTIRFSSSEMASDMPDWTTVSGGTEMPMKGFSEISPVEIVAATKDAVAIVAKEPVTGESIIEVFNFTGPDEMWVYVGGAGKAAPDLHVREYFHRVR